jgi:high-affinity nickel-transport protein
MTMSTSSLLLLGLVLGARHATDADHVAEVSTIVARERSLSRASWVGVLWGVGHSATILVVGGAIVLFRFAIPPRVGWLWNWPWP